MSSGELWSGPGPHCSTISSIWFWIPWHLRFLCLCSRSSPSPTSYHPSPPTPSPPRPYRSCRQNRDHCSPGMAPFPTSTQAPQLSLIFIAHITNKNAASSPSVSLEEAARGRDFAPPPPVPLLPKQTQMSPLGIKVTLHPSLVASSVCQSHQTQQEDACNAKLRHKGAVGSACLVCSRQPPSPLSLFPHQKKKLQFTGALRALREK